MRSSMAMMAAILVLATGAVVWGEPAVSGIPPGARLRSLSFGESEIEGELREVLPLREGSEVTRPAVRRALRLLALMDRWEAIRVQYRLATPSQVDLRFDLTPAPWIEQLRFEGDVVSLALGRRGKVTRSELERVVPLRRRSPFRSALLDLCRQRILETYRRHGYYRARVRWEVQPGSAPGTTRLTFFIESGPAARIGRVVFEGDPPGPLESVLPFLYHRPGRRPEAARLDSDRRRLLDELRRRDYLAASVELEYGAYDDEANQVDLVIHLRRGDPVRVRLIFPWRLWNLQWGLYRLFPTLGVGRAMVEDMMVVWQRRSLDDHSIEATAENLRRRFERRGYMDARVTRSLSPPARPGGPSVLTFEVHPGERTRIGEVLFEGNRYVPDEDLARLMRLARRGIFGPPVFQQDRLEEDLARLQQAYVERGFRNARVRLNALRRRTPGRLDLLIHIDEGLPARVARIEYSGAKVLPREELDKLIAYEVGAPYVEVQVDAGAEAIGQRYRHLGYADVQVQAEVELVDFGRRATVWYHVTEGARHLVGPVLVAGKQRTRRRVTRNAITLGPGDPINVENLFAARQQLLRDGIFHGVRVQPSRVANDRTKSEIRQPVVIRLHERKAGLFESGFGWSSQDGLRAFGTIGHNNLFGTGRRLTLRADVSERRQKWELQYRERLAVDPQLAGRVRAFSTRERFDGFTFQRRGLTAYLERESILRNLRASLAWQVESADVVAAESPAAITREFHGLLFTIAKLVPSLTLDTRDDPFAPSRGTLTSASLHAATKSLLSDATFLKVALETRWFASLGRRGVLAMALRLGSASSDLPPQERFFLGGARTLRGFRRNEVGPAVRVIDTIPGRPPEESRVYVGGNAMVLANVEIRWPLFWGIGATLFVDAGNTEASLGDVVQRDLRYGAGLGLNYETPIGPVRYEVGWNLNRRSGEPATVGYVSIGYAF